ncbi:MAG: hemerythrin domain-containing protein [Candidatus Omnitrophica bacterium]|nr:hemerythrin domain-containing protein [Candidatus Omnitrophota bacterium]
MLPIGLLMIEHRLIERLINLMDPRAVETGKEGKIDSGFLDFAIDFLKTYADKCHHGKEEDILFRTLEQKSLSVEHKEMIKDLLHDHLRSRKMVDALAESKNKYLRGDKSALNDITGYIQNLVQLYRRHIKKEDKDFFLPMMGYLDKQEQSRMLKDFQDFDQNFIQSVYKNEMINWEGRKFKKKECDDSKRCNG